MANNDLMLHYMNFENGSIDMGLSGEPAKLFLLALIELFEQNGGKNFLTLTVENEDKRYAITIQNLNGEDSPAEKIKRLEDKLSKYDCSVGGGYENEREMGRKISE